MSEKNIIQYEQIYVVYFETTAKEVYETFYMKEAQMNQLYEQLNSNRVVKVGDQFFQSRQFKSSEKYDFPRIPDKRVKSEVAHRLNELRKGGRTINASTIESVELSKLKAKRLAIDLSENHDNPPQEGQEHGGMFWRGYKTLSGSPWLILQDD